MNKNLERLKAIFIGTALGTAIGLVVAALVILLPALALGSGPTCPPVNSLAKAPLTCASANRVPVWNGATWTCAAAPVTETDPTVNALGKAALTCASANHIPVWSGSAWSCAAAPVTETDPTVNALSKAALTCASANHIPVWSGSAWSCAAPPAGSAPSNMMTTDTDQLLIGGQKTFWAMVKFLGTTYAATGIRLSATDGVGGGPAPGCSSGTRGLLFAEYDRNDGFGDKLQVCLRDSSSTYGWAVLTGGLTAVKTVKGSDGANCTMTFARGLLTATTCP